MTKKQLKHKLKEVKNVNKVKPPRKNRNGKEGVNKTMIISLFLMLLERNVITVETLTILLFFTGKIKI